MGCRLMLSPHSLEARWGAKALGHHFSPCFHAYIGPAAPLTIGGYSDAMKGKAARRTHERGAQGQDGGPRTGLMDGYSLRIRSPSGGLIQVVGARSWRNNGVPRHPVFTPTAPLKPIVLATTRGLPPSPVMPTV